MVAETVDTPHEGSQTNQFGDGDGDNMEMRPRNDINADVYAYDILPEEWGYDPIDAHEMHNRRVLTKELHSVNYETYASSFQDDTGSSYCIRDISGSHVTVNPNSKQTVAANASNIDEWIPEHHSCGF